MKELKPIQSEPKNYLIDMDGVLVRGRAAIPGAQAFVDRLRQRGARFLIVTNNPMYTPGDLAHRLRSAGLEISPDRIFTSAIATAQFLRSQSPGGTAYAIGDSGLTSALHEADYIITDHDPDYVVLGETMSLNLEMITRAIQLVAAGARFIATNPDPSGPTENGIAPACGAVAAMIEKATGRSPLFIGKPAPLMMRAAMNYLNVHSQNTVMVGDRMDTDIIAGIQAGMETILVLTGVTAKNQIARYPYRPTRVVESVAQIEV